MEAISSAYLVEVKGNLREFLQALGRSLTEQTGEIGLLI